jgi:hypothetical protein
MTRLASVPPLPPVRRVHVCADDGDDEEENRAGANGAPQPEIRPMVAPDAKGELVTTKEPAMPRGVYVRKKATRKTAKKTSIEASTIEQPKQRGRRKPASTDRPPFAVFSDGSVLITKGDVTLSANEACQLVAFITRLQKAL